MFNFYRNLFANLTMLTEIRLNNNHLHFVDLQCAIKLRIIHLQHNQLNFPIAIDEFGDFDYFESVLPFKDLHQVKFIDLSFNNLTDLGMIYVFYLKNYYQNITIDMKSNKITNIMPLFLTQKIMKDGRYFQNLTIFSNWKIIQSIATVNYMIFGKS